MKKEPKANSIHPRVVDGRTYHAKVNTCGPSRMARRTRGRVQDRLDRRISAWVATCADCERMKSGSSTGFRRPGSRNPRKLGKR